MKIKRVITAGALATVTVFSNSFAAETDFAVKAVFGGENPYLTISGKADVGKDITVIVMSDDADANNLTVESANDKKAVFNMLTADKDGLFESEMGLPEAWEEGLYKVLAYQDGNEAVSCFTYADISDSELSVANGGSKAEIEGILDGLGIESTAASKYGIEISTYLYENRPAGGYTKDTLLKETTASLALCMVKSGEIKIDTFLDGFAGYLETEQEEISELKSAVKSEIERLIKSADMDKTVNEILDECVLIAKINKAESVEALQKLIIDNKSELGISLAEYNKIDTDYKKSTVFEKMLGGKNESLEDVRNSFDETGALIGVNVIDIPITNPCTSKATIDVTKREDAASTKVFIWEFENQKIKPIVKNIEI